MLLYFWQGVLLGFPAAALPGPMQAFFLAHTLRHGWRRTLPTTLAPLLSDGPIILLVLFVLTRLPAVMLSVLQLVGGLFLLYLAYGALQSWRHYAPPVARPAAETAATGGLLKATTINLLNPNPYTFWATVGGVQLLAAWRAAPINAAGFLLGMYLTLIGGFCAFVLLFGVLGRVDSADGRVGRLLALVSALALALFGLYQLATAVPALAAALAWGSRTSVWILVGKLCDNA